MKKSQILLVTIVPIAIFLLVFSPHFSNPFPLHVDEWKHITEAIKLKNGEYEKDILGRLEIGFHIILLIINKFTNLILIYKFLPALWAALTSLIIFYTTYKLTNNNFILSLSAMIFFGSIKSNVNLLGLWFFTPLTFTIPFIFLYIYFFVQGLNLKNKKYILTSLTIMLFLIPIHAISVLFAIPILAISTIQHLRYIKKEYKLFSLFLLIPILGITFFSIIAQSPLLQTINHIIKNIQFKKGWGVLELNNSFFEIYSLIGYILAAIGIFSIIKNKKTKSFLPYIIWPIYLLISIYIFRLTNISYLAPYQRNFYYFAISLPFLSAIGLDYIINNIIKRVNIMKKSHLKSLLIPIILIIVIFLAYKSYYLIPKQLELYTIIEEPNYQDLIYLKTFPKTTIMADPFVSTAIYAVSEHYPIATLYFYHPKRREEIELFFETEDCNIKNKILEMRTVNYVISKDKIECNWNLIRHKNDYIYQIN